MICFLEQLLEEFPGKSLIVWNNVRTHRCPEVATFAWPNRNRLELQRWPPYAPEINPDEGRCTGVGQPATGLAILSRRTRTIPGLVQAQLSHSPKLVMATMFHEQFAARR